MAATATFSKLCLGLFYAVCLALLAIRIVQLDGGKAALPMAATLWSLCNVEKLRVMEEVIMRVVSRIRVG